LSLHSANNDSAFFWAKLILYASVLVGPLFYFFVRAFPKREFVFGARIQMVILFWVLVNIVLVSMNLVFSSVEVIDGHVDIQTGAAVASFGLLQTLSILAGSVALYKKYRQSSGLLRQQLRFISAGIIVSLGLTLFVTLILPLVFKFTGLISISPFLLLISGVSIAYAIVRYRFLDIRVLVSRSIVFALLVFLVTSAFVFTSFFASQYISVESGLGEVAILAVAAAVIVLLLDPAKRFLALLTNKVFFSAQIDYQETTRELTNVINQEIEIVSLVSRFVAALAQHLSIGRVTMLLQVGDDTFIEPDELLSSGPRDKSIVPSRLIQGSLLTKILKTEQSVIILDELDILVTEATNDRVRRRYMKVRDELEALNAYAAIPVMGDSRLEAVVVATRKLSGEAFSGNDIALFEVLAPQLASALEKARLYQEAKEFGHKLQREVEKATTDLKSANVKLQELDNTKSEFMSIASHQLRTPLAGILGYLSMISAGDYGKTNPEQKPVIEDVLEATRRLIRIVNIFLNATRIEAGRFVMNYAKVPLEDVIEAIYKELKTTADAKDVKLVYKKKKLGEVEVDMDKIKDVILNLTDNAIKYSPKGTVTITAELTKKTAHVMVKDSGVGIAPDEVDNLFEKFVRGSGIARVEPNGSGLGLFIAKKITEGHGGRIWAESEGEGKGSTFQFEIPLKADPIAKKKSDEFKARAKKWSFVK